MATRRSGNPYVWVTWLTKLMVGENSCEWASWFKAHHDSCSWEKADRYFGQPHSMAESLMKHTALVSAVRTAWEAKSCFVFTENQNTFRLAGTCATLGGKPDLIALADRDGETVGTVMDVKSGKPNPSHVAQVMVYMYAVASTGASASTGGWSTLTTSWTYRQTLLLPSSSPTWERCSGESEGKGRR